MKVIPAVDILDNKVVRLKRGDFNQKTVYSSNPSDIIRTFIKAGFDLIHVVNLLGAKSNANKDILFDLVKEYPHRLQIAGGIKTEDMAKELLNIKARRIVIGTAAAIKARWLNSFTDSEKDRIIIAFDIDGTEVKTNGWLKSTRFGLDSLIKYYKDIGYSKFLVTDIQKDGLEKGPSFELYKMILKDHEISLIASGGVSSIKDLQHLKENGLSEAIVGKAIYESRIKLYELKEFEEELC